MDFPEPLAAPQAAQSIALDPVSLRVLGALMEKEMTTPDVYPLSINALMTAANQRSSREPVMDLTEEQVRAALSALEVASLVVPARGEGRVQRFEHRIRTVLNLRRDEAAVLCLLLLRGPQTPGELRSRADRLFAFDDLVQVQATLDRMGSRPNPIATAMQRAPGSREVRFRHLLGDAALETAQHGPTIRVPTAPAAGELGALQEALLLLERRVRALEAHFEPGVDERSSEN